MKERDGESERNIYNNSYFILNLDYKFECCANECHAYNDSHPYILGCQ